MIIVPPFRGELGIVIRYHVPAVRALPRPLVVCHEPGLEALYPACQSMLVECKPDAEKRWTHKHDEQFVAHWSAKLSTMWPEAKLVVPDRGNELPKLWFLPHPHVAQRNGARPPDVVICPRRREYGAEKNWDAWPAVAAGLKAAGLRVFAAGARQTSYTELPADERAWDYPRTLDACIEAFMAARLVVATDAGLAHLAVLCGTPLLLVGADGGKVAPGPARNAQGKVEHEEYWHVRLDEYYHQANHTNAPLHFMSDGWGDPSAVVAHAEGILQ